MPRIIVTEKTGLQRRGIVERHRTAGVWRKRDGGAIREKAGRDRVRTYPHGAGVLVHQMVNKQAKVQQDKRSQYPHESEEAAAMVCGKADLVRVHRIKTKRKQWHARTHGEQLCEYPPANNCNQCGSIPTRREPIPNRRRLGIPWGNTVP